MRVSPLGPALIARIRLTKKKRQKTEVDGIIKTTKVAVFCCFYNSYRSEWELQKRRNKVSSAVSVILASFLFSLCLNVGNKCPIHTNSQNQATCAKTFNVCNLQMHTT